MRSLNVAHPERHRHQSQRRIIQLKVLGFRLRLAIVVKLNDAVEYFKEREPAGFGIGREISLRAIEMLQDGRRLIGQGIGQSRLASDFLGFAHGAVAPAESVPDVAVEAGGARGDPEIVAEIDPGVERPDTAAD
jgi:hypothetical protein